MATGPALPSEDEQVSLGIDDRQISLHAEQEDTQKKTFTCWINSQLAKHTPPSVISDLFADIKKGHVLLDLLEVLSGQQLPRDKGFNTFQRRTNIEHALTFLKNRSIKLINIHVADIVDGNPSIILGLIWTIILHFHIQELAQTLSCDSNLPSLDSVSAVDSSPTSSPPAKKCPSVQSKWQMSAKKALLSWAQEQCGTDKSVEVTDFKSSWRNGMAFLAVIHALRPDLIDMKSVKHRSNRDNLQEAFRIAERELNIPKLLEPEDVDVVNPDEKSIMTYVAQFLQYSKDAFGTGVSKEKIKEAMAWLTQQEKKLKIMLKDSENETYSIKYECLLSFVDSFNKGKKPFLSTLSIKTNLDELNGDQLKLREAWDRLNSKINMWKTKLNHDLPSPLHQTEVWLQEVEKLIEEDLSDFRNYSDAMTQIQEKMALFKSLMDKFDYHLNTLQTFENGSEKHLPLVPPNKLKEMERRIYTISKNNFIPLLEFHYYKYLVLSLLDEVKSKLDVWNIKYGNKESVESLLKDWHNFIEEKRFLAQCEASFQKCEESCKNLSKAGEYEATRKQYEMMEYKFCTYKKSIYNVKSALQKVLEYWTTYVKNLHLLKACLEETKKEQIKKVPFDTLCQWNQNHATFNEVGNFLIEVSNDEVGLSISKELRRVNKRWKKFITKTQLEAKLSLAKKQNPPMLDNSVNNQQSNPGKATAEFFTNTSGESPETHNQNVKADEKSEKENEECTGQLKMAEEVEKLTRQVEIWEAETKSVLDLLPYEDEMDPSVEESLQHLIAKGSMYEELISRTEDTLQMDIQNISSQESLQHILTARLQTKIQEVKDKVQINVVKLLTVLKDSEDVSPTLDVRLKVQESQKELQSSMDRAEQLLNEEDCQSDLISKYKEAIAILNTKCLIKYLKAVEELKTDVTKEEKQFLEEKSKELSANWQFLHHEMSLYIQQLKIDIEKGKIMDSISKLEKQINKEKKLIRRGRTKGLMKEHEACFSEDSSLYQLEHHMAVLRELCDELTSPKSQQEVRRALREFEQKIARLRKCAAEIQGTLRPMVGDKSRTKGTMNTSEKKGKTAHGEVPAAETDPQPRIEKAYESKNYSLESSQLRLPQEESIMNDEMDQNAFTKSLIERYDTYRENLTLHLTNNKCRITSEFPSGKEWSSTDLQDKVTDLQILKHETDACWKEFETTSLNLEELVSDTDKEFFITTRETLKEKENELQKNLISRMESLETALQIVLPVERESLLICSSDLFLQEIAIQEFQLIDIHGIYQNLRTIQHSIAKQMEICKHLEQSDNLAFKKLHPLDLHASQKIVETHRTQLKEMDLKVQMCEDILTALEEFLTSLRTAESMVELGTSSDTEEVLESTFLVESKEGKIHPKDKARHLDKCLEMLEISLKNVDEDEITSCEEIVEMVSAKLLESSASKELLEKNKLRETCVFKSNEFQKNIQDLHNQISKIGLRDPTAPAVKQRKKLLMRLNKDLDEYEKEKKYLEELADSILQFEDDGENALSEHCRNTALLWENTKASITDCIDQCDHVLELLKQYQNFKSLLTSLIQKEESAMSLQSSYMGKENLRKRITEIEIVKEEFNENE